MSHTITGSCYCGNITFEVEDNFSAFYFCHCEQCRKLVGSAHAANLFTAASNIKWTKGQGHVKHYSDTKRSFSQTFCPECGSPLPHLSQDGKSLIIPAGSLDSEPSKALDAEIFIAEETQAHKQSLNAPKFPGFPE